MLKGANFGIHGPCEFGHNALKGILFAKCSLEG